MYKGESRRNEMETMMSAEPTTRAPRSFRRTPRHLEMLESARDHKIRWRVGVCGAGAFANDTGRPVTPGQYLVALYELRNAQLIVVDRATGTVRITATGLRRIEEWRHPLPLAS